MLSVRPPHDRRRTDQIPGLQLSTAALPVVFGSIALTSALWLPPAVRRWTAAGALVAVTAGVARLLPGMRWQLLLVLAGDLLLGAVWLVRHRGGRMRRWWSEAACDRLAVRHAGAGALHAWAAYQSAPQPGRRWFRWARVRGVFTHPPLALRKALHPYRGEEGRSSETEELVSA
jgi:hypothetical protein